MELKSLTQSIKCVEAESGSLRMFLVSLVLCSIRLGVPFIAPRQLGAVGGQLERPILPSVEWCTATIHVRCAISFHIGRSRPLLLGAGWRTGHCSVHTRQSGAPSRLLELATCCALIARTTVGRWRSWLTGQSGAPSDSPMNYSHVAFSFSRERRVHRG
jgi:hypothetical protein